MVATASTNISVYTSELEQCEGLTQGARIANTILEVVAKLDIETLAGYSFDRYINTFSSARSC
jgi:hypothetical protein